MRRIIDIIWSSGLAPALAILALLVTVLAYQLPVAGHETFGRIPTPLGLAGVYPPEAGAQGFQRWTTAWARVTLPGVGPGPSQVRLRLFGGAEPGAGRRLRIATATQTLFELDLHPDWQELQLFLPPGAADRASGDLSLLLETTTFRLPPDERDLGLSLAWIEVHTAGATWPAAPYLVASQLALVLLLSLWILRLAGFSSRQVALPLLLLLSFFGALLAGWTGANLGLRMQAALGLPLLLRVLPLSLLLAILLRMLPLRPMQVVADLPVTALLRLAVLLIFTLRLAGMLHPQFIPIDQSLRANQLLLIASGREELARVQLEQQFEWGTREPVPYSLLTYYMLLPLTALWRSHFELVAAIKVATALFEASIPLLLLALLRDGPQRLAGAAWAGLLYAALPVGFLKFHDGSFPTTLGVWLTLLALVAVRRLIDLVARPEHTTQGAYASPSLALTREGQLTSVPITPSSGQIMLRGVLVSLSVALALGAYVTHIAFVPFLGAGLLLSMTLLGGAPGRQALVPLLLSAALGLLLGWTFVYGSYTMTLIQRTIPTYLGLIVSEGSVGRDSDAFFGTPINSFSQHMVAHFRVWPVLLAAAALTVLLTDWRARFVSHLGLAYAALLLFSSVAERWFGLWNKHMVFVAPGIALLAGIALAWLWRRGRAAQIVCVLLLVFLFWEVLLAWGNRVLWYQLPPNAL